MLNIQYNSLLELIKNNPTNITHINDQYIHLLSYLTTVNQITDEDFVHKITEISNIGEIIISYIQNSDGNINIIGTGTVMIEPKIIHNCKSVGHIEDIVVHPSYREHGIAKNILKKLVNISENRNCYKVILDCNNDLIAFYEKNGFQNHGTQMSKYIQ